MRKFSGRALRAKDRQSPRNGFNAFIRLKIGADMFGFAVEAFDD
jgi:hypothetical protein